MANFILNGSNGKISTNSGSLRTNASPLLQVVSPMQLTFTVNSGVWLFSLNGVTSQVKSLLDQGYKMSVGFVKYTNGTVKQRRRSKFPDSADIAKEQNISKVTAAEYRTLLQMASYGYMQTYMSYDYRAKGRDGFWHLPLSKTYPTSINRVWQYPVANTYAVRSMTRNINRYKASGFTGMDLSDLGRDAVGYMATPDSIDRMFRYEDNPVSVRDYLIGHIGFYVMIGNNRVAETAACEVRYMPVNQTPGSGWFAGESLMSHTSYSKVAYTATGSYYSNLLEENFTFAIDGAIDIEF